MKNFYCCTKERRGGKPVSGKCINRASLSKISVRSIYALFTYKKWCFSSSVYSFYINFLAPYTLHSIFPNEVASHESRYLSG